MGMELRLFEGAGGIHGVADPVSFQNRQGAYFKFIREKRPFEPEIKDDLQPQKG